MFIIDAGHGGEKTGAVGRYSQEKDITLKIAKIVGILAELEEIENRLTRTQDIEPEWKDRVVSNAEDIFVSIHCNGASAKNVKGISTFHYPNSEKGKELATEVKNELIKRIDTKNRGVKQADFYVLRETKCPAVLVECGFITNLNEENKLNTLEYQCKVAVSIIEAIKKIKESD